MIQRSARLLAAATLAAGVLAALAPPASAHEEREVGDLRLAVGFGEEPAYAGQPNSVQLLLSSGDRPIVDLGDTLSVDVTFGDAEPLTLPVEPFFEVGEFGSPGDYRAWFIPTAAGRYTFHLTGSVHGQDVDETFSSGPHSFDDVVTPTDLQYPEKPPSTAEIADRIDREVPRLTDAIAGVRTKASDDVAAAKTLGLIGIVVGALGLIVATVAITRSKRKAA